MGFLEVPELNTRLGTYRAYHLAAIIFISSFLAGYDSGIAGGILTFKPFIADFHTHGASQVSSLTVGLEQLGSFVAAFATYPITNAWGRKRTILGATALFCLGVVLQVCPTGSLGGWYAGRIVAGLGMGAQSVVVPMYSAEMAPREIRGRCGSFYQWLYTWGVLLAYWVDYAVAQSPRTAGTSAEWQLPVGLELVAAAIMLAGCVGLPESTRWLLAQGRTDEAWAALAWIRGLPSSGGGTAAAASSSSSSSPQDHHHSKTHDEFREMQLGLRAEHAARDAFSPRELLEPANRLRFVIGPLLFVFQNATGSSALAVFAPQYFKLLVGSGGGSGTRDLLLTGLFGAVKVLACTFFIWVLSERFGRRALLTGGSALMAACMLVTALIVDEIPTESDARVTNAGRATVAMIYLDIMIYNCSWGPLPWAYAPEIFPTRTRALGLATSMLAHWATSVCFSMASPYMVDRLGANTFLVFMGFDVLAAVFCFFLVRETKGQNLEHAAGTAWAVAEKPVADGSEGAQTVELVEARDAFSSGFKLGKQHG